MKLMVVRNSEKLKAKDREERLYMYRAITMTDVSSQEMWSQKLWRLHQGDQRKRHLYTLDS